MPLYKVTKTWGHNLGLTACFRQPYAESHCRHVHGYALEFSATFACAVLDKNNWVLDFGILSEIRDWLKSNYDHRLIIAENDPQKGAFETLHNMDLANIRIMSRVGCEAFAEDLFWRCRDFCRANSNGRVWIERATCAEHGGNKAEIMG